MLRRSPFRRPTNTRRATGPTAAVVAQVLERDNHQCQVCAVSIAGGTRGVDFSCHHRRPRRAGGSRDPLTNSAANLITLCGSGTDRCHGWVESRREDAYDLGLLLRAHEDPREVPVSTPTGVWLLGEHGEKTEVEA